MHGDPTSPWTPSQRPGPRRSRARPRPHRRGTGSGSADAANRATCRPTHRLVDFCHHSPSRAGQPGRVCCREAKRPSPRTTRAGSIAPISAGSRAHIGRCGRLTDLRERAARNYSSRRLPRRRRPRRAPTMRCQLSGRRGWCLKHYALGVAAGCACRRRRLRRRGVRTRDPVAAPGQGDTAHAPVPAHGLSDRATVCASRRHALVCLARPALSRQSKKFRAAETLPLRLLGMLSAQPLIKSDSDDAQETAD